ncbi:LysR substrate-binding domain-containing protein [Leucobacter sp. GX24907]
MELHHLRYFVAVAEERHFGRAAMRLHVTQPPVSQRIRDLERELELTLFSRGPQGVQLTEAGTVLLSHARQVLREVDLAGQAMKQLSNGPVSELRVGLPPDTSPRTIQVILQEFSSRIPDTSLQFSEMSTSSQLESLRLGEIDVAVARRPLNSTGLASSITLTCPVGVWLSQNDPLSAQTQVHLSQLGDRPLIMFPRRMAPATFDRTMETCKDAGYLPPSLHYVQDPSFVYGLVQVDFGVHFNIDTYFGQSAPGVVYREIDGEPLAWQSSVIWVPQRRTDATDAFVEAGLKGLIAGGYRAPENSDPASD